MEKPSIQSAKNIFQKLWDHYTSLVVDARTIEKALRAKNDTWNEDHVAFRTLPGEHCGVHILEQIFTHLGYKRRDPYYFEDKQLNGFWMEPPRAGNTQSAEVLPKIFLSELILNKFSPEFKIIVEDAASQVKTSPIKDLSDETIFKYLTEGPMWARPTLANYETLRKESEYAAWTLIFGSRVNHFTVSVHLMKTFDHISKLNNFITTDLKIPMNQNGGLIKGDPSLELEQSSTLASQINVLFQDGVKKLPYAFVEFAYRYPLKGQKHDGLWESYYQGFVANNADKIFESTNLR